MSMHNCKICGGGSDIFPLDFEADETDACEEWTTYVCGSCWEIIAAIAKRACRLMLNAEGADVIAEREEEPQPLDESKSLNDMTIEEQKVWFADTKERPF